MAPKRFPLKEVFKTVLRSILDVGVDLKSLSSYPIIALKTKILSIIVLVIGPAVSNVLEMGIIPLRLTVPIVGFRPTPAF